ncbi:MAG: glycosyltransferase [Clostridia bacterium]|nr:glycosyltransferase [Clostridia bacterium]
MKKIMLAVTSLKGGGAERVVSVWASQLAEKGYDVAVFTYSLGKDEYQLNPKVKRVVLTDNIKDYLAMGYLKRYKLMRKKLKEFSPDIVISFLFNMQVWMAAAGIGMKHKRIDTVRISPWHHGGSKLTEMMWRACFKTGDLTILQSDDQKAFFGKSVQKKCVVVPNPLNADCEAVGKDVFGEKALRFCAAGRLCPQKNFPMLIKAFAKAHEKNPDITLDIYGKGSDEYTEKLNLLINENNADQYVRLCGRTNDMHGELIKHDAFIMSSDYEGMPNALAEAMAVGLVCISTDCRTGPRDLIRPEENGFLVPVGDVDAMAEKIIKVSMMDSELIKSTGASARQSVTDFCGQENSLAKLIEAIEMC